MRPWLNLVEEGENDLEIWLACHGIWLGNIQAAANKVIDRYNRELGNYGFIQVSDSVVRETGFDPWPTMTVTIEEVDPNTMMHRYYGYSQWFTCHVPEGTPAVCYDLSEVLKI